MARSTQADTPTAIYLEWLSGAPLSSPSAPAWDALTAQIALHPPRNSEVDLLAAALEAWPDTLRIAPESWLNAASRVRQPPAYWSLARTVHCQFAFGSPSIALTPAKIRWLLTSPSMHGIRHLRLQHYIKSPLTSAILEGLAQSQALSGLRSLDLLSCGLARRGLNAITQATWLSNLESLNLDHWFMFQSWSSHDPEAAAELLGASHLSTLTDLRLNLLAGPELLEVVLTAPHLSRVTTLHLGGDSCSDALIRRMVADPRRWRGLEMEGKEISPAGACLLAEHLGALESLCLTAPIGREGVMALLDPERLPALRYLVVHNTDITEDDAMQVRAHPGIARLDHFSCGSKGISSSIVVSRR
jgi:hypothetical protein